MSKIHGVFAFGIIGTAQKLPVFPPANHHGGLAFLADQIGWRFFLLDVFHFRLGFFQLVGKKRVKFLERLHTLAFARFNGVQFVFHIRGESDFQNGRKTFYQKMRHHHSQFRRIKLAFFQLHVFAFLYCGKNRGIGAGASNAFFLQFAHQRRFGKTRRRLCEFLFRIQMEKFQLFFFADFRQKLVRSVAISVAVFILVILAFRIDDGEAGEFHDLSLRAEKTIGAGNVNGGLIENGRIHLTGDKAVPDQLIKFELIGAQILLDVLRFISHAGRTNRFMGILRFLRIFVRMRLMRQIIRGITFSDVVANVFEGFFGYPVGVRSHICDETHGTFLAQFDSFIEFLRDHHGLLG